MGSRESPRFSRWMFLLLFAGLLVLLLAILAGYFLFGRPPGAAPPPATTPPVDNTTPTVTPNALPLAPSDLTAEDVAVYDILVGWRDNSDNEDGFKIYRQRTDQSGDLMLAGMDGANQTSFLDPYAYCGETYEYIVAAYNALGESSGEACWAIMMPPCPPIQSLKLMPGPDKAYNFLTGGTGKNGDFYITDPSAGTPNLMSDQPGQMGLLDLGDVGDVPLWHVDLPSPVSYGHDPLPATFGHTFAALASDGKSVIVFKIEALDKDGIGFSYILWRADQKITTNECQVGRKGRQPPPPKTCQCQDGNFQLTNAALLVQADPRCTRDPQAACQCQGDDLVFASRAAVTPTRGVVFPKDPVCTGINCACKGADWVCTNGFTIPKSVRCTQPQCRCDGTTYVCSDGKKTANDTQHCSQGTQPVTQPPTQCRCEGTTYVCADGSKTANDTRHCPKGTQPVTQPPTEQQCFCEVANNAWDGNWVCTTLDGKPISSTYDPGRCPPPVCGNGNIEGTEQCDGGGCPAGETCNSDCTCSKVCSCVCVPTISGTTVCRDSCTGATCKP